ncbi:MAG: hypothetical protein ACTJLM_02715 [Ehrlichia sp.]
MLFSFILRNIKNIFIRLSFIILFLYISSFMFISMREGISVAFSCKDPRNVAIYIYKYLRWCYYNTDLITYSVVFKIGISLIVPFYLYLKISKIDWCSFSKSLCEYTSSVFRKNNHNAKNLGNNINVIKDDYCEKIYNIKKEAMITIEKSINKMISEILYISDKRIGKNYDDIDNDRN